MIQYFLNHRSARFPNIEPLDLKLFHFLTDKSFDTQVGYDCVIDWVQHSWEIFHNNLSFPTHITNHVPQSAKTEELAKKVVHYKVLTEAKLKVDGLVTTQLLCKHRLIANF
uniref:Uncharacterized protein n=1 Tax=Cannabis sativa TaxID=3483 RepID=A0A803NIF2_CANSA